MDINKFLNHTITERLTIALIDDPDVIYYYGLLSKLTKQSIDELKSKFKIEYHIPKQSLTIEGDCEDIAKLYYALSSRGLEFESITMTVLRISIPQFINKIR
jgi:hypothetical protein